MGLWPFGRAKADVESASRVVVLRARDGVPMRAKITVRLAEPQTAADAELVVEQCADLVRLVVREAPSAPAVLGLEAAIATEVAARMPKDGAPLRNVEIAGLHIVGDPGHLAQRVAAPGESPAWLHAAPSSGAPSSDGRTSSLPRDRPTPIQPVPPGDGRISSLPRDRAAPAQPAPQGEERISSLPRDRAAPAQPAPQGDERISSLPRDRPTPIHPVPSSRSSPAAPHSHRPGGAALTAHATAAPAPRVSLEKRPRQPQSRQGPHAGQGGPAPGRQGDPFTSTAISPSPHVFRPEPSPPAPTPHAGIPVLRARPADPHATTAVSPAMPPDGQHRESVAPAHARPGSAPPVSRTSAERALSVPGPPPSSSSMLAAGHGRPPSGSMLAAGHGRPSSGSMLAVGRGRPSSGSMLAVDEPSSPSRRFDGLSPPSARAPHSVGPASRGSSRPPPAAVAARRRVVAARLPLPSGAGPYEVARGLTPLFRDTAGRILVAFLRIYDLTVVRRVPFDMVESDILASLTAPSDGAPGTYAACHAAEIQRWREAFGMPTLEKLQRESNLAAAALAYEGLTAEGVPQREANGVVEGLAGAAFGDPDMIIDLGRYLFPAHETMAAEALANLIEIAGEGMPPGLELALEPLFTSLREDVAAAALIAKDVMAGA